MSKEPRSCSPVCGLFKGFWLLYIKETWSRVYIPNKIANGIKTQMPWYDPLMDLPNILTLMLEPCKKTHLHPVYSLCVSSMDCEQNQGKWTRSQTEDIWQKRSQMQIMPKTLYSLKIKSYNLNPYYGFEKAASIISLYVTAGKICVNL